MFKIENQSEIEQEVFEAFKSYLKAYLLERDMKKTFAFLSPRLSGFGTGKDEFGINMEAVKSLMERGFQESPNPIHIEYDRIHVVAITPAVGIANAVVSIRTVIKDRPVRISNLRLSSVFAKVEGNWYLEHLHSSLPSESQKEGQSFPSMDDCNKQHIKNKLEHIAEVICICASCKKIKDDWSLWHTIEDYFEEYTDMKLSHGLCQECAKKIYQNI